MKKFIAVLCCLATFQTFAQRYRTNDERPDLKAFLADTTKTIFYISNYSVSDLGHVGDIGMLKNAKICRPDFKISSGDLLFSNRNNETIFYYIVPEDQLPKKTK